MHIYILIIINNNYITITITIEIYNMHVQQLVLSPQATQAIHEPTGLEVMGFSAAQQPDAPALPLRHVVLDHTQLAVALHMERLQPYFAARVQLLKPWWLHDRRWRDS